jgi:hypothetical protein
MPRFFRYLRIAISAVCGIACVLLVALWIRSYWHADSLTRVGNDQILTRLGTGSGSLFFGYADYKATPNISPPEVTDGWEYQEYDPDGGKYVGWMFIWGATQAVVGLPAWFVTLLLLALATLPWVTWRFTTRTLLIATTVIALVLGAVVYAVR